MEAVVSAKDIFPKMTRLGVLPSVADMTVPIVEEEPEKEDPEACVAGEGFMHGGHDEEWQEWVDWDRI